MTPVTETTEKPLPTPPLSPSAKCTSQTQSPPPESELFPTLPEDGDHEKRLNMSFETLRKLNVAKHNHDALCRAVQEEKDLIYFVHSLRERIQQSSPNWDQYQALCMIEEATTKLQQDYDRRIAVAEGRRRDVLSGARTDRMTRPESYATVVGANDEWTLAQLEEELKQTRTRCLKWMKEKMELEKKRSALESSIAALETQRQQLDVHETIAAQQPKLRANVDQLESSVDTLVRLLSIPVVGSSSKKR